MPPDPGQALDLLRFLGSLGVGGAIAGLLFFFYRKDVRSYTDLWKEQAMINFEQTKQMMALVAQNSAVIASNTEVLKSLHRRIDHLDGTQFDLEHDRRRSS